MAEDLRAVGDNRPVRARRAGALVIAVRYVRKRKKALRAGALGVAATVILMMAALFGWRYYSDWRLGRVVLSTPGPALTAVVLSESGDEPFGEPFDIGTHTTLSLPAGDYRLRVHGVGLLGQTYRFAVHRAETRNHELSLDRNRLPEEQSIPYPIAGDALVLKSGKADFIAWTGDTLLRRDLTKGEVIWDAKRTGEGSSPGHDSFPWMRRLAMIPGNNEERPGALVQPAADLDGDGTGDIVMAFARTPSLLAVSGRDGARLWTYSAAVAGLGGPDPLGPDELAKAVEKAAQPGGGTSEPAVKGGRVIGSPVLVQADGVPDLLDLFFVVDDPTGSPFVFGADGNVTVFNKNHDGRRVIAAISGRTGRALWSRTLDQETMSRPWLWEQDDRRGQVLSTFDPFDSQIAVAPGRKGPIVALVVDSQWTELDPTTGQARGRPIDFGFKPLDAPRYADIDGDAAPEVLALQPDKLQATSFPTLVAFSTATGRRLWGEMLWAYHQPWRKVPSPAWPLVADFDRDGRDELVVPHIDDLPASLGGPLRGPSYQGFRVLDGPTGKTRWFRPFWEHLRMGADTLPGLLAGPDLDGDGVRDLVTVYRDDGERPKTYSMGQPLDREWVYVDAISGRDGHPIWWWHEDVTDYATPQIGPPLWWGRGPDGWPMLVVPLGGKAPGENEPSWREASRMPPVVRILEASTGRMLHTIDGLAQTRRSRRRRPRGSVGLRRGQPPGLSCRAARSLAEPRQTGPGRRPRRRWDRGCHDGRIAFSVRLGEAQDRQPYRRGPVGPRRPRAVDADAR
jgi:outer membrane protein assembly factor BamB